MKEATEYGGVSTTINTINTATTTAAAKSNKQVGIREIVPEEHEHHDEDNQFDCLNYTYHFDFVPLVDELRGVLSGHYVSQQQQHHHHHQSQQVRTRPSNSSRLRFTCSDVSPNVTPVLQSPKRYLALGTTSGSVHIVRYGHTEHSSGSNRNKTTALVTPLVKILHEILIGPITSVAFAPVQLLLQHSDTDQSLGRKTDSSDTQTNSSAHSSSSSSPASPSPPALHPSMTSSMNGDGGGDTHSHTHSGRSVSGRHLLHNILLAIGTTKGNVLIVDVNLRAIEEESKFESNPSKQWSITYQNSSFSSASITLLRWDNAGRLFIGDSTGKVFVLHDIVEMKRLMMLTMPALLANLQSPVHQFDVADKFAIVSTAEQRVLLLDLEDTSLTPVGSVKSQRKKTGSKAKDGFTSSGVCALSTYRLVELNTFHYEDRHGYSTDDGGDDYDQDSLYPEPVVTKAYRLVNADLTLYVTRPKCRFWAVSVEAEVLFTHQFAEAVQDGVPCAMFAADHAALDRTFAGPPLEQANNSQLQHEPSDHVVNFDRLYAMYWRDPYDSLKVYSFVVTFALDDQWSRVFVLDLNRAIVVATSRPLNGRITELKPVGNDVFVTYQETGSKGVVMCVLTLGAKANFETDKTTPRTISSLSEECSDNYHTTEDNSPADECSSQELQEHAHNDRTETVDTNGHVSNNVYAAQNRAELLFRFLLDELQTTTTTNGATETVHPLPEVPKSKCPCGLPISASIECVTFRSTKLIHEACNRLDPSVALLVLEMAFNAGHWPLYMFLLAKLGEVKFYVYFALLLNDSCLITQPWFADGGDCLADESLWTDVFEYIGLSLLHTPNSDPEMVDDQLEEEAIAEDSNSLYQTMNRCEMCRLKLLARANQWPSIVAWFEAGLLRLCLLHCSTGFVLTLMRLIIDKFVNKCRTAATVDTNNTTSLFSLDFYVLLLRFEVMQSSTSLLSAQVIARLHSLVNRIGNPSQPKHSSAKHFNQPPLDQSSNRMVVDLTNVSCAHCGQRILSTTNERSDQSQQSTSTVKLYRSCEHIFHPNCVVPGYRRCRLCHPLTAPE